MSNRAKSSASETAVTALDTPDLPEAARILRLAFATFFGAPDPDSFWSDRDYVHGRHGAPHVASLGARLREGLSATA